jgi:3-isopropylmalate/(R)-2-methylmalate dehydratase small subunit
MEEVFSNPKAEIKIDLKAQTITLISTGAQEFFDINDYKKDNMLHGFDDIDYLINIQKEITSFAANTPL